MIRLAVRLVINAISIYLAANLLDGMVVNGFKGALITALVFGLMNATVRPLLLLLTLPINILTLGLFTLVINGLTLAFTAYLISSLRIDGLVTAILGALLISVFNWILGIFEPRKKG